jgi:hypothetical protein
VTEANGAACTSHRQWGVPFAFVIRFADGWRRELRDGCVVEVWHKLEQIAELDGQYICYRLAHDLDEVALRLTLTEAVDSHRKATAPLPSRQRANARILPFTSDQRAEFRRARKRRK